jgi:hypothetical protein
MKRVDVKKVLLVFVLLIATIPYLFAQHKANPSQKKKKGLRILMIGDSNTEIGNITMPIKTLLDSIYGNYGTGFSTLNTNSIGRVPDSLQINCDSNWTMFDMRNDFCPMPPPYYSPNGLNISSDKTGAAVTIQFSGNAIDLYFLEQPVKGSFSVAIDAFIKDTVELRETFYKAGKKVYKTLSPGRHSMVVNVLSGSVTLIGIDIKKHNSNGNNRTVLHKWANAWASTNDFINIEKTVFSTSLKELNPDKVVILLGTNDHNLDHRDPLAVKENLKELIVRIKRALPLADVVVVSTFTCDGKEAKTLLPKYVTTSFPEAARETKSKYWDMNTWFGDYTPQKLPDGGVHVTETIKIVLYHDKTD